MTRFPGFSASSFDHPGICATIRSLDRRTWVLIIETVLKIRRMHQVYGQSISANATGHSLNTVRKYLRQLPSEPPKYHHQQPASQTHVRRIRADIDSVAGPQCQVALAATALRQATLQRPTTFGFPGRLRQRATLRP